MYKGRIPIENTCSLIKYICTLRGVLGYSAWGGGESLGIVGRGGGRE